MSSNELGGRRRRSLVRRRTRQYARRVEDVDWKYRAEYVRERHGIDVRWADEAMAGPDALRIVPDPASQSGRSIRTIGYSPSAGFLDTAITVVEDDVVCGVNSWRPNDTDTRRDRDE